MNDGTNEGIRHRTNALVLGPVPPARHPSGPRDTEFMFDKFLQMVREHKYKKIPTPNPHSLP